METSFAVIAAHVLRRGEGVRKADIKNFPPKKNRY
jgi:hypothetical protein